LRFAILCRNPNRLPRQAQDKHKETLKNSTCFIAASAGGVGLVGVDGDTEPELEAGGGGEGGLQDDEEEDPEYERLMAEMMGCDRRERTTVLFLLHLRCCFRCKSSQLPRQAPDKHKLKEN
jgi:hypothetical protein